MRKLRGVAGCPQCKVPWVVEDWATYLSVVCPQCGRKLGEVATDVGLGLEVIGQPFPRGVPAEKSVVVPTRLLTAHYGTHRWAEHDGYPRHQHSINGALTIPEGGFSPRAKGAAGG
jgi:hypothetical protein